MTSDLACPGCGAPLEDPATAVCPGCFTDLVGLDLRVRPEAGRDETVAEPVAQEPWHCRSGHGCPPSPIPADVAYCPVCLVPRGVAVPDGAPAEPEAEHGSAPAEIRLSGPGLRLDLHGDGPWLLGRTQPGCEALDDRDTVSRQHARVRRGSAGFEIADAGSSNGTYVDGARLADGEWRQFAAGATLGLGRTVTLHVEPRG